MSNRLNKHGQNEMYDEFGNIIMGKENTYIQYQECTLKNMLALLSELFGPSVSQESRLSFICSEDVNNLDIIKDGVEKRFGVCITSADIVKSANVEEFTDRVAKLIESPRFPASEKELRKEQLSKIAKNGSIQPFIGNLSRAELQLTNSLNEIKRIKAPIGEIPDRWLGRVKKEDLEKVIIELDKNTHTAVNNLGNAIECTNRWIDEICKMLIWIIQIENDIYGIAEESSSEALRISKLLSQEGASINGLTEVAAIEQSKRRRIQQKVKEFKSDIEGKIEFLNDVHKSLLSQFEEHKKHIQTCIDSTNKALVQKVGDYISNIDKKFSELRTETTNRFQQLQQTLKEEDGKRSREFDEMKSEQKDFVKKTQNDFQSEIDSINKILRQKVGDYFSNMDNKFSLLHNENTSNFQQLQQMLKEEEGKRSREFDGMKSEQKNFIENTRNDFQKEIDTANEVLKQKIGNYFSDMDNKFSKLNYENKANFQQLQQTIKDEEGKRSSEFKEMKSEQKDFSEKAQKGISEINEKTSVFIEEQSSIIAKLQKRTKLYKVISFTTFVISVAALLFAILK